jgi:hypothetical protein
MGLDGVELVMEIEETFGVVIPHDQAGAMVSVGDIYEFLSHNCSIESREGCVTSAAFYRLRAALCDVAGVERSRVRPAADLDSLVPRRKRRQIWPRLYAAMGLRLPGLKRPR